MFFLNASNELIKQWNDWNYNLRRRDSRSVCNLIATITRNLISKKQLIFEVQSCDYETIIKGSVSGAC